MIVLSPARCTGKSKLPAAMAFAGRLAAPMTAARYLRLRRVAAGLSRRDLARRLSRAIQPHYLVSPAARVPAVDEALALIELLEADGARARYRATIAALADLIPLDVDVYHQLANEPAERHPHVCRGCGGTEGDLAGTWAVANLCADCLTRPALAEAC